MFSLDGLGLLGYDALIQPRLSGALRRPLHLRPHGAGDESAGRFHLYPGRSAHRFREPRRHDGASRQPRRRSRASSAWPHHAARLSGASSLFRANKRGFWSLWIFLALFVVSLVRRVHRQRPAASSCVSTGISTVPVLQDYPETTFGGDFETYADYKRPLCRRADQRPRAG